MKLSIQSLTKAFGGHDLFSDFSLEIDSGTRLAVVGPNGTGKTTLLRMLAGVSAPDAGKVVTAKGARVGYVAQELDEQELERPLVEWVMEVLPSWSDLWREWDRATAAGDEQKLKQLGAKQAELEQMYGYNPEHRAHAVLSGLGFTAETHGNQLKQFSGGWRERAKLARVLVAGADVLLLDEPTNHLDLEAIEWLEQFLLDYPGVLVFAAHDRVFMNNVGTHVLFLGGPKPLFRKGAYDDFLIWQAEMEGQRAREEKRLEDELAKKMDFVRRFSAKATKARQSQAKKKQAQKLERELDGLRPDKKRKTLAFSWPEPVRAEKTILNVVDLSFGYGGEELWTDLNFILYRGQRVALAGPNGSGKTTMLKLVTGDLEPRAGKIEMGGKVEVAYFSQHQLEVLDEKKPVLAEIRRLSDPRTTEEELMSVLGLFLLGQAYFDRPVGALSGGEKSRLVLATLFLRRANFLVLDEPTNHLDLETREALISALERFDGTILLVAHDRWLLQRVAEQVWGVGKSGFEVHLDGWDGYERARRAAIAADHAKANGEAKKGDDGPKMDREALKKLKRERAEERNKIYRKLKPLQDKYAKLEEELSVVLDELGELESTMAAPETYADSSLMSELLQKYEAAKQASEVLMEKMERLESEIQVFEDRRAELAGD